MDIIEAPFFIQSGKFSVFLAREAEDIDSAQRLRHDVFYKEMGASETATLVKGRDVDRFDDFAENLIVKDRERNLVVGTYRLLRRASAARCGSFYTEQEFDISPLKIVNGEILEVSRSCVAKDYRIQTVIGLLWRGLAEYILHYDVLYLFGCGSFHGTDLSEMEHGLSYLYYNNLSPESCRTRTLEQYFEPLRRLPKDKVDLRKAAQQIPALIRGYTRLGGGVGDGIFIDQEFNTVDVCVVVDSNCIKPKFAHHYNTLTEQTGRFPLRAG